MIQLLSMLAEDRSQSVDRGCLMAMVPEFQKNKLAEFGKKLVREEDLYLEGNEFGRETDCHVTILYGFLPDLHELQIRKIIQDVKPFTITLTGIDTFQNHQFDVVKFSVESPVLRKLNEIAKQFPNKSSFPNYKPHMTIAYEKSGTFKFPRSGMNIRIPINEVCYSPARGGKSCFDL